MLMNTAFFGFDHIHLRGTLQHHARRAMRRCRAHPTAVSRLKKHKPACSRYSGLVRGVLVVGTYAAHVTAIHMQEHSLFFSS